MITFYNVQSNNVTQDYKFLTTNSIRLTTTISASENAADTVVRVTTVKSICNHIMMTWQQSAILTLAVKQYQQSANINNHIFYYCFYLHVLHK